MSDSIEHHDAVMAPPSKRQCVRVEGPAAWLMNSSTASAYASAFSGEGASFRAVVVKVDHRTSAKGNDYAFVTLINTDTRPVEIPYDMSKDEREEYKRFAEYNKTSGLEMPNPTTKRPPWVLETGGTLFLTTFRIAKTGVQMRMGTEVFVSKCTFSITFATEWKKKNTDTESMYGDDDKNNKFKRNAGDPYINFTANMRPAMNHGYKSFREILAKCTVATPKLETESTQADAVTDYRVSETAVFESLEYPEESRIPGVAIGNGAISTFTMSARDAADVALSAAHGLKCGYNVAMISNAVLIHKARQPKGVWIDINNPACLYDKNWQIPEEMLSGGLPLTVFKCPVSGEPSNLSGFYSCGKPGASSGSTEKKVCIKDQQRRLMGMDINGMDRRLYSLSPIFNADVLFGIVNVAQWELLGAQVFRSLVALCFITVDAGETNSMLSNNAFGETGCDDGVVGTPLLFPDYMVTFSHAGLRVSQEFAFKLVLERRSRNDAALGEFYVRSDHAKDNPLSQSIQGGLEKPPVVCLREFTGMLNTTFSDKEWEFVVVPPLSVLTDSHGNFKYEDETQSGEILRDQGYFQMNSRPECHPLNEKYIQEEWMSRESIRNQATVMAVYKL